MNRTPTWNEPIRPRGEDLAPSEGDAVLAPPPLLSEANEVLEGVVVRSISGFYDVETSQGTRSAAMRAALRRTDGESLVSSRGRVRTRASTLEPVVVGDRVRLRRSAAEGGRDWIEEVLPRERVLARRAAGERRSVGQTLVANVDQVLLVFASREPQPKARLADRLLVAAESQELPAVVCLNKIDLMPSDVTLRDFAELEALGYPLLLVSARSGEGVERLRAQLAGKTSALVGPSGVGKSSLLNAVQPGLGLKIGAVSAVLDRKGRHTTRFAQLLPLLAGGFVADTPGLREFGLWSVDPELLDQCFPEMLPHQGLCRFVNCDHLQADGCAIRQAVEDGEISERRYGSYVTLREEAEMAQQLEARARR